jgi:hypothetical protein
LSVSVIRCSRLKPWKTKPMLRLRSDCQFVLAEMGDIAAEQEIVAAGRCVEAAEHIHEGRLAGSGLTHDRHELAGFDAQIGAPERRERVRQPWRRICRVRRPESAAATSEQAQARRCSACRPN